MNINQTTWFTTFKKYLIILIFSFVYAAGISLFLSPNNLAPGGVSGLSIIINHFTGLSTGMIYFIINIPIMIIGMYKLGFKFLLSTLITIILSSTFMDMLSNVTIITSDKLLAALVGGVLCAIGLGMIFKVGSTSGGTDVIVRLLKLKYPYIETGRLFLILDAVIVVISAVAFKDVEAALYAGVAAVVASVAMDKVLYGTDGAKLIFIISSKNTIIVSRLLKDIETGVTYINGAGAYTESPKKIIMCVSKKQNLPKIQNVVRELDPDAFMIISSANEVLGQGYKSHFQDKL